MLGLQYTPSIARYVATKVRQESGVGALRLRGDLPHPRLPGPGWTTVRPRLTGICGSDQAMITGKASLYLDPLTSGPFVPGHEVVGETADGRRVVVEPALGPEVRGVAPGRHPLDTVVDGEIAAGLQTGFCRDTGGGWSEGLVAHESQLHEVPAAMHDEDAVLAEPLACALHAARAAGVTGEQTVAVLGAGTIGLLTVLALREAQPSLTIVCAAKHRAQELEARRLGADETCAPDRVHVEALRVLGAGTRRLVGRDGKEQLLGGYDAVLDCVGSGASLETACSAVRPGGRVVLVGMPGVLKADLALLWLREVQLHGAYGYREDFPTAIELAHRRGLGRLVGGGWHLRDYKRALAEAPRASRNGKVKTVFDLRNPA